MMNYLKNPFILLGSLGLIYYVWKRNQIIKNLPKTKKEQMETLSYTGLNKDDEIPEHFKEEVKGMSKEDIKHTIAHNQRMMKRVKLSPKEKDGIEAMLDYLEQKYDTRIS